MDTSRLIGTISFQANDKTDVFYVAQVLEDGIEASDEAWLQIEDQFDSDKAWVTGNVPRIKPVNIEGDTSIIHGWFKSEAFTTPFVITVYVECEMAEELEEVIAEETIEDQNEMKDFLETMEVNL